MPPPTIQHWGIPTPFPVGDVNAWRLPGRVPALIDPGPRTPEAWAALERHLSKDPVRLVLFTHHHVDHAGLAARLQREHGVEVAAQRIDAGILAHWGDRAEERQRDYDTGLRAAGVPDVHRERMRYGGIKIERLAETARPDRVLEDGDRIALGDADFEVLHCPGHTAGSMLLRSPDHRFTFSGDTLLQRITPNALSVRASERHALLDYLATLRRLAREPLGEILPGHGHPFDDAPTIIAAALHHADVRRDRILRILREGPGTAFEVANRLFLRLPDDQLFLAMSETLGHLEVLVRTQRVEVERRGDVDQYAASPTRTF